MAGTINTKQLAQTIAADVAKMILPAVKKMIVEHNKRILSSTSKRVRKAVREEVRDIVYESVINENKKTAQRQDEMDFEELDIDSIVENKKPRKKIDGEKRRSIAESIGGMEDDPYKGSANLSPASSVDDLINSADLTSTNRTMIEGGDDKFRKKPLIKSGEAMPNQLSVEDMGNVDYSDMMEAMGA
jgi:hypothetical protein